MGLGRTGRGGGVILLAGSGGSGIVAPNISYAGTPFNWTVGESIGTVSPTNSGGASSSWTVQSGALPAGVSLNATTGVITGTPTVEVEDSTVVIRATNGGGSSDATIHIGVLSLALFTAGAYGYWDSNI